MSDLRKDYEQLIEKCEREKVLIEAQKLRAEQEYRLVDANNFAIRIREIDETIERFRNQLNKKYSLGSVVERLLSEDFGGQTEVVLDSAKNQKINSFILHGTPECGLQYFILRMDNRGNSHKYTLKADQVMVTPSNERENWLQIAYWFGIFADHNTRQDLPTLIATRIADRLMEKPVIAVIYQTELWEENYLHNISTITTLMAKIPFDYVEHPLTCYFVHTGGAIDSEIANPSILPLVETIPRWRLIALYHDYQNMFNHCADAAKTYYDTEMKPGPMIDFFLKHSSYAQDLRAHFDQRLPLW